MLIEAEIIEVMLWQVFVQRELSGMLVRELVGLVKAPDANSALLTATRFYRADNCEFQICSIPKAEISK